MDLREQFQRALRDFSSLDDLIVVEDLVAVVERERLTLDGVPVTIMRCEPAGEARTCDSAVGAVYRAASAALAGRGIRFSAEVDGSGATLWGEHFIIDVACLRARWCDAARVVLIWTMLFPGSVGSGSWVDVRHVLTDFPIAVPPEENEEILRKKFERLCDAIEVLAKISGGTA